MNPFIEVARQLAGAASRCLLELRRSPLVKSRKSDHSLVTNADHAADQLIREGLHRAFPDHSVLTEENGLEGNAHAEYLWVVDPLDGTKAYAKGMAGYSVMIGLLKAGKPYAGVVMDPSEGQLFDAVQGEGAFLTQGAQRVRVQVSKRSEWNQMPLVTSTGFPEPVAEMIRNTLPCPWIPAVNSVGVKVGFLVRQEADLYLNHHSVHYWDTCAPQVILEEAGGIFTFLDGTPLSYSLPGTYQHAQPTLASNGTRHEDFRRELRTALEKLQAGNAAGPV